MKKISILPNFITAFGLACGLFIIFKVNMVEPGACCYTVIKTSALFLLLAAFADFIDGAAARILHAESEFGVIFDSLSDAVSFGVVPSVLLLKSLSLEQGSFLSFFTATGAMVFSLCGVLRLARFNVKTKEAQGNIIATKAMKNNFTGLPIPAAAIAAVSVNLLFLSPFAQALIGEENKVILLDILMIILGYLMVSPWKFPSLKAINFKVWSFQLAFFSVALASFTLFGILHYFPIVLTVLSWGYIFLALVLSVARLIAGRKSKTLEDFEPEQEDIDLE